MDVTEKVGVHFKQEASKTSKKYLLETMGSGVAVFDYDNDGRLDIFFANGARIDDPMPRGAVPQKDGEKYWNRMYHQKPDGTFEDVTAKAGLAGTGYSTGVAVGDYDNDGFDDLFVAGYGHSTLYHNNGDGTFTDVTASAGVAGSGWATSAAWVDYDNDGKLDLVVARYMIWDFDDIYCGHREEGFRSYCHPDLFKPISILLYHNDGNGKFNEVSEKAGVAKPAKGLGLAIADFDHDGFMDILLANDSIPEFLFHNEGNGTFEEIALPSGIGLDGGGATFAGMGVDFEDYNNDGWPDAIITDLANQKYALYANAGDGSFDYTTLTTGLGAISLLHSGWGVRFLDYDNDGWKDLFIVQAHVMDTIEVNEPHLRYRESPLLLWNDRGKRFVDVSGQSGAVFHEEWAARGMAVGDLDNDGRVDVVVTSLRIFRGVPFAAPPVGDLRWQPPQPVKRWSGVRKAVDFGPRLHAGQGLWRHRISQQRDERGLPQSDDLDSRPIQKPKASGIPLVLRGRVRSRSQRRGPVRCREFCKPWYRGGERELPAGHIWLLRSP